MKKGIGLVGSGLWFRSTILLLSMAAVQFLCFPLALSAAEVCEKKGDTIVCSYVYPYQDSNGIQLGPDEDEYKITVEKGVGLITGGDSAISVGSKTEIILNGLAENNAANSPGLYGQRANTIEGASENIITIGSDGKVLAKGHDADAAAIKMMGYGNVITNNGVISAQKSAAVWFQNSLPGTVRNRLINRGAISTASSSGIAIGSEDGLGVELDNYGKITGAVRLGNGDDILIFRGKSTFTGDISTGGGDDTFTFYHQAALSGRIDAGKGRNTLTLINAGPANDIEVDTLAADMTGITHIVKQGLGRWNLTGDLLAAEGVILNPGLQNVTVEQGILNLAGSIEKFYGQAVIKTEGTLEASAQNLPVWESGATADSKIQNDGLLRFVQAQGDDGSYGNLITGTGKVEKAGAGRLLLEGENTYEGGTIVTGGTLAITNDKALGKVDGGLTLDGGALEFAADNTTLNANRSLTMGAKGGAINTGAYDLALNQVIGGTGSLTKMGDGTLQLTKVNTYSGGTHINEGTLAITEDRNLGAVDGGLTFGDNGTLRLDADNVTLAATRTVEVEGVGVIDTNGQTGSKVASNIVGDGTLVKDGDGTLILTGSNIFSGTTEVKKGELQAGSSCAFSADSRFKIGADGTLNLAGLDQSIGGLEGDGIVQLGTNKLTINQDEDSTFSGTINGAAGSTLSKSGDGGLMLALNLDQNINLEVNGSGYLGLKRDGALNFGNKLSGNGTLLIDIGDNALTLDAAKVGADFKGTLDIRNDTKLALNGDAETVLDQATLALSKDSQATLDNDREIGGLTFNGGTLNVADHKLTVDTLEMTGDGGTVQADLDSLNLAQYDPNDPSKNIFDYADGAAQTAVVEANTVTGQTGQLGLKDKDGNDVVATTTVLTDGSGEVDFGATATVENSGDKKGVYIGSGVSRIEAYEDKNLILDSSDSTSSDPRLTAQLTGSGNFIFKGDDNVRVGSANSDYTGTTTIDKLQVTTTTDKAFGNTSLLNLINNGSVDLDGRSLSVGGLAGEAGTEVKLGTTDQRGGLTVNQNSDQSYGGNISGYGDLTKSGSGTLVLTGANNYTGTTTVQQGRLQAGSANAFNQNQAWRVNGGQVDLNGFDLLVSQLSGSGGEIMLTNEAGLTVDQSDNSTYQGLISGSGGLVKNGSGDLSLGGSNTYSGDTTVNSGRLSTGAGGVLSALSVHYINGTAELRIKGDQSVAGLGGDSSEARVSLTSGAALNVNAAENETYTYDGRLTGEGRLVKSGTGQQVLTNGNNNFSGGIEVQQGSVKLTTARAAGSGNLLIKSEASLIVENSGPETMNNTINGRGTFVKDGAGSLALNGQVDLGTINVRGGLMSLADTVAADEIIIAAGAGLNTETLLFTGGRTLDLTDVGGNFGYNRLEVRGRDNRAIGALPSAAGKDLHFLLPADIKGGEVMLSLDGPALNIADASLSLEAGGYLRELIGGDQIILIDKTTGTIAEAGEEYRTLYGATTYYFGVDEADDQLAVNYKGRSVGAESAKTYLEAPLAALAMTADHGRLSADLASRQIINSTEQGVGVLLGITANHNRVNTGSHANIDSVSVMAGPAWRFDNLSGVSRLGVFVEAGSGEYDAFNSFLGRRVKGSGDIDHVGGMVFGRHDFENSYYMESSVRLGRVETDYKTRDLGANASFDSSALYWGVQVGGGYLYNINDQSSVQPYVNVYFTRQNSDDVTTKAGERIRLETSDSVSTRLGARYSHAINETITARVGAAWDQELDGEQKGTIDGTRIDSPSMKGASAFGEIGLSIKPQDAPYFVELNAFGNAGKREGGGGQAAVGFNF